jgi:hypothetical protein
VAHLHGYLAKRGEVKLIGGITGSFLPQFPFCQQEFFRVLGDIFVDAEVLF